MLQQQLSAPTTQEIDAKTLVSKRLQDLVNASLETLEAILVDETIPLMERANVAFQILGVPNALAPNKSIPELKELSQREVAERTNRTSAAHDNISTSRTNPVRFTTVSTTPKVDSDKHILPITFIQIDNFLNPNELEEALKIAFKNRKNFGDSMVYNKPAEEIKKYRQSSMLHHKHYLEFADFLKQKVLATLPSVLDELNRPYFDITDISIQLTAHNDGAFFTVHSDANTEVTMTRTMTYVYYFYQEPKAFSGGELRMYETEVRGKDLFKRAKFENIEPRNNSIVFFPSRHLHEVMPVSCPSKHFEDSRFTFNGWIHR